MKDLGFVLVKTNIRRTYLNGMHTHSTQKIYFSIHFYSISNTLIEVEYTRNKNGMIEIETDFGHNIILKITIKRLKTTNLIYAYRT